LLYKVIGKEIVNIVRYYYYKTVCVGGKGNNIHNNIYKELDIIKATNYKLENLIMLLKLVKIKISIREGQSSSRKRSSSYINTLLPPRKHIYLGSPSKNRRRFITLNRAH